MDLMPCWPTCEVCVSRASVRSGLQSNGCAGINMPFQSFNITRCCSKKNYSAFIPDQENAIATPSQLLYEKGAGTTENQGHDHKLPWTANALQH